MAIKECPEEKIDERSSDCNKAGSIGMLACAPAYNGRGGGGMRTSSEGAGGSIGAIVDSSTAMAPTSSGAWGLTSFAAELEVSTGCSLLFKVRLALCRVGESESPR